jgi:hypothetical protein
MRRTILSWVVAGGIGLVFGAILPRCVTDPGVRVSGASGNTKSPLARRSKAPGNLISPSLPSPSFSAGQSHLDVSALPFLARLSLKDDVQGWLMTAAIEMAIAPVRDTIRPCLKDVEMLGPTLLAIAYQASSTAERIALSELALTVTEGAPLRDDVLECARSRTQGTFRVTFDQFRQARGLPASITGFIAADFTGASHFSLCQDSTCL